MPRKAGEKKKEMRETTNRTPAWVYVVSVVSAVALGLGTIAIADYLRPSKRAARQAAEQAERMIAEAERKIAEIDELLPQWVNELRFILDDAKTEHELYELVETYHTEWISIMGYRLDILLIEKKEFLLDEEYNRRSLKSVLAARQFLLRYPHSKHADRVWSVFRDAFTGHDKEYIEQKVRDLRREQRER